VLCHESTSPVSVWFVQEIPDFGNKSVRRLFRRADKITNLALEAIEIELKTGDRRPFRRQHVFEHVHADSDINQQQRENAGRKVLRLTEIIDDRKQAIALFRIRRSAASCGSSIVNIC
jgi:hypothetical protein